MANGVIKIDDIIDTWYESAGIASVELGHIGYTPVSYVEKGLFLRPFNYNDATDYFEELKVIENPYGSLPKDDKPFRRKKVFTHPIPLEAKEEIIGYRHKRRPVIVLSPWSTTRINRRERGVLYYLCLPLYSIQDEERNPLPKYTPELIFRIKLLNVLNMLWLPAIPSSLVSFQSRDSFVDYDHLQVLHNSEVELCGCKLHDEVLSLLRYRLLQYAFGFKNKNLDEYSDCWYDIEEEGRAVIGA